MNTVAELVSELESKGVRFYPHSGTLRVDAPQGMLTVNLRTILAERKREIVAFLQAEVDARDQSYNTERLELAGELVHLFNERASTLGIAQGRPVTRCDLGDYARNAPSATASRVR